MNNLEFIFRRRSIRTFTNQPVPDELINLLLKAAMAAPTAMNTQPWEFVVVRDSQILNSLRAELPFGKMEAPCAISVCGNMQFLKRPVVEKFWVQDCSAASQNILLAVSALELGAVWCGVYPIKRLVSNVSKILGLPENIIPLNVIFIGFPIDGKPSRTQFDPRKVFRETYQNPWLAE